MESWSFVYLLCLLCTRTATVTSSNPWKQPKVDYEKATFESKVMITNTTHESSINTQNTQDCPAPAVCSCGIFNNVIDCSGKGLSSVPAFSKSDSLWDLYLKDNHIHSLRDDDFHNIQIQLLDMSNNSLTSVSDNAFRGLESVLNSLYLESNRLTNIPETLTNLKNLTSLTIQQNPISNFDENVMTSLSSTINTFHFGSEEMVIWPPSVQLLNLFELGIFSLPLEILPETAFANLSLSWLTLNNMKLKRLPSSFKGLENLYYLSLNTDEDLTLDGVPRSLFESIKGLNSLQIINSKFTALPDIFHYTTGLFQIELNSVPINDFPAEMLPEESNITIADFKHTLFNEVPSAISKMKKLSVLSLNYNNITTIQSSDLSGLSKLEYVSISNTPLHNISLDAFKTLTSLQYLALDNTALTSIPRAVEEVTFDILSLFGNKLICTCQSMGWMKNWSGASRIGINGHCNNLGNMEVWQYVRQNVPKCP